MGEIVYRPDPTSKHRCDPPTEHPGLLRAVVEPVGTVWECGCRKQWVVRIDSEYGLRTWKRKWLRVRGAPDA